MDMDVLRVEDRRFDSEISCTRPDIGPGRLNRFLHHVAQLTGHRHTTFTRQHNSFDIQQLAANFRPGQTGDNTDKIFLFSKPVAEPLHACPFFVIQIALGNRDLFQAVHGDFLHRLARQFGNLTLKITHTGFPGVVADDVAKRFITDRPLTLLQAVCADLFFDQVTFGDLHLFVFRVTGQANDLHTVEQRLWHPQRICGRHKHHFRQVIIDFQIVIRKGAVLFRVEHFQQCR